jgi:hypothetical protein
MEAVETMDNSYETFPQLEDLLEGGGRPGVEYMYVMAKNMTKAQHEGFSILNRVPMFEVSGHPFALMGRGTPIRAARNASWTAKLFIDIEGKTLVLGPVGEKTETKVAAAAGKE